MKNVNTRARTPTLVSLFFALGSSGQPLGTAVKDGAGERVRLMGAA